ncbi:MAG: SagB/ThcOx family dehydrogenase [Candidatus Omnitrophica bacterium]|nr:SagB/ThcOx family dehydrogenase [Candidatus Omnitrophota bacterium]
MRLKTACCIITMLFFAGTVLPAAKEMQSIQLLKPRMSGGKPLMQALKERQTLRNISSKELPAQIFSDLLWAAFGVNRPEIGKRTAPSAVNWQEMDIYVATPKGLYLYNAKENMLEPLVSHDIRPLCNMQPAALTAPVVLLYVADYLKMGKAQKEMKDFYSAADTGFISQNVYLFCASEGLATVVMGAIDKDRLSKEMNLRAEQKVILVQPVGYPRQ